MSMWVPHRRVADFTARIRGLTPDQKREIEQWYLGEQKYFARLVTDHIADRIDAAEEQHHIRIRRWLRGTLTVMVLVTVAMITCVAVTLGAKG
ncbi:MULTISPECIES: hypothetical protein [Streptomyces]|uniref:DUF3040 domain-containing protein n=2 Tax=Streptomyces TaxID=1883 RepID=A0ABV9ILI9_9ACTN